MKKHRWSVSFAALLALFLLLGQQGAMLHALGHAFDRAASQEQLPAEPPCDLCLAATPLIGALPSDPPAFHPPAVTAPLHAATAPGAAHAPPRVHYRSRAPPAVLHA